MIAPNICPYVGLAPFEKSHEAFFFGRTIDSVVLADNILARPTAVLYGASGVGKSSVLNVGLPKALRNYGIKTQLVFERQWQEPTKLKGWLNEVVETAQTAPQCVLIVVLDQFEEYFLYRTRFDADSFERALATLLSRTDIEAHILFSLRDDGLHLLDSLRRHLPSLLDNTLELRHLDDSAMREAIEGPIIAYNEISSHRDAVQIEDGFVDALITNLREAQSARSQDPTATAAGRIELPFLQLTMESLWTAMSNKPHRLLDTKMLSGLGGVDGIVTAHLIDKMDALSEGARRLASQIFHYLVTPSGGKFAYLPEDLAYLLSESIGAIDPEKIGDLLRMLADSDARVLRRVGERFELFHDILARPILNWRAEYLQKAPYAFLVDVVTGDRYPLIGGGQIFGRLTAVGPTLLSTRSVSRNHLLVLSTGLILDLRSRFGTTVNAYPVLFGHTDRLLRSGDIIVLANTAVLRFWTIDNFDNYSDDLSAPDPDLAEGWAFLIDGQTRRIVAIKGDRQYLTIGEDNEIFVTPKKNVESFAMLMRNENGYIYLTSLTEDPPIQVVERRNAFLNREWPLANGQDFLVQLRNLTNPQNPSDQLEGAERGLFKLHDRWFEVIPNLLQQLS